MLPATRAIKNMQTITTKYIGPTNFRGSRVKATTESGISITLGWNDALNSEENHVGAAIALMRKLKWVMAECGHKIAFGGNRDGGYTIVPLCTHGSNVRMLK